MKKRLLLASQRIEVQALIRASTLKEQSFHWSVEDSETTRGTLVTRLEYGSPRSATFFLFDWHLHQHYAIYSWGPPDAREEHFAGHWPSQARHVERWIDGLGKQSPPVG